MITDEKLIDLNLKLHEKTDIILHLLNMAAEDNRIVDKDQYMKAVMKREMQASTSLGYSVAIPHGKSDAVVEAFIVFARSDTPVTWNDNPVKLFFLIGVPESNTDNLHLKILGNISKHLIDDTYREKLMSTRNKNEIMQILNSPM